MIHVKVQVLVTIALVFFFAPIALRANEDILEGIERLAAADPKPFMPLVRYLAPALRPHGQANAETRPLN